MNQVKIGKFIAECRKKQNLTQEQLGEQLGITHKAVSKWECGKGLPDVTLYQPLCKILNISLNEFFAGQYLKDKELNENAEKNLLNIAREEKNTRKKLKNIICLSLIVIATLIISLIGLYKFMCEYISVSKTFELNWGIVLPNNFKEEYYIDSGSSFHGDGKRYSVFTGNSFITSLNGEKNIELETEINDFYNTMDVPKEKQINFTHNYSWNKIIQESDERNYIYCIFDNEINKYYFYEFFC